MSYSNPTSPRFCSPWDLWEALMRYSELHSCFSGIPSTLSALAWEGGCFSDSPSALCFPTGLPTPNLVSCTHHTPHYASSHLVHSWASPAWAADTNPAETSTDSPRHRASWGHGNEIAVYRKDRGWQTQRNRKEFARKTGWVEKRSWSRTHRPSWGQSRRWEKGKNFMYTVVLVLSVRKGAR